jgi:hypothetical protein
MEQTIDLTLCELDSSRPILVGRGEPTAKGAQRSGAPAGVWRSRLFSPPVVFAMRSLVDWALCGA